MSIPSSAADIPAFEAGVQHERQRIISIIRSRYQNLTLGPGTVEFQHRKGELQRILMLIRAVD